jgi:hypothetical protein
MDSRGGCAWVLVWIWSNVSDDKTTGIFFIREFYLQFRVE